MCGVDCPGLCQPHAPGRCVGLTARDSGRPLEGAWQRGGPRACDRDNAWSSRRHRHALFSAVWTSFAQGGVGRCGGGEEEEAGRREEEEGCSKRTAMNEEDVFVLAHLPVPYLRMIWETWSCRLVLLVLAHISLV
jgi:hypothetical protein